MVNKMSAQEGVTEEPDADDGTGDDEKGFMRFIRRRPAKEKRSETEWVDTLRAQPEPEPEPEEEPESPFMAGEGLAEQEPEPEPAPLPEVEEEPEPAPQEQYQVERRWRRRHQDEMDEIHNYIDRVIGTDLDPLERHKRLADLGPRRHHGPRRDIASVNVEGLDEELMIAFTFPKEELRSARMVYETEGGYVIEVTRAIGGDEAQVERQHYTVSRVGSVAHALDKLRAREIDRRVQARQQATAETPAPQEDEYTAEDTGEDTGEDSGEDAMDPAAFEQERGESSLDETPQGYASSYTSETEHVGRQTRAPEAPAPETMESTEDDEAAEDDEEAPEQAKGGLIGGFASRFKRGGEPSQTQDEPPAETDLSRQAVDEEGETAKPLPEPEDQAQEEESKPSKIGGLFKRKDKEVEPEGQGETQQPGLEEPETEDDEALAGQEDSKPGLIGGFASKFKREGKGEEKETQYKDQCLALTEEGVQCRNSARGRSKYCSSHFGYRPPSQEETIGADKDTEPRVEGAYDTAPSYRRSRKQAPDEPEGEGDPEPADETEGKRKFFGLGRRKKSGSDDDEQEPSDEPTS